MCSQIYTIVAKNTIFSFGSVLKSKKNSLCVAPSLTPPPPHPSNQTIKETVCFLKTVPSATFVPGDGVDSDH